MKKKVFFVLMLCVCGISTAQITISKDKPLHFAVGFGIGAAGGYTAHHIFNGNAYWTWAGAVGSSLAAGIVKESIDKADYGVWDNNDILFTTLGGIASGFVLDLFLKKSRKRKKYTACNCFAIQLKPIKSINIQKFTSRDIKATIQAQRILEMP